MGWPKGKKQSAESNRKRRVAMLRRMEDPAAREKMEACLALSPLSKSEGWTAEERAKISAAMKGKKKSPEHAEKIRQLRLGTTHTEETKRKMSLVHKGKAYRGSGYKQSAEERAMRSEIQKKRCADPDEHKRRSKIQQARWDRDGNKHKPETIAKMKAARAKQVIPLLDTKPERNVQLILDQLGIPYRKHLPLPKLGHHQWDFVIRDRKLLIEVDGCYWHGCEGCYPNSVIGKKNRIRDREIRAKAEALGWQVLVIWEHDLESNDALMLIRGALEDNKQLSVGVSPH